MNLTEQMRSAGHAFLKEKLEEIAKIYDKLKNKTYKNQYIDYVFMSQNGWYDSAPTGTRTRVNCAIRIIREGNLNQALTILE